MQSPGHINSPSREIEKIADNVVSVNIPSLNQEAVQVHVSCRNCGHAARNHFAENSPIRKRCLEKGCMCSWAWDGKTGTKES